MTERNDIAVETIDVTKNYGPEVALRSIKLTIASSQ